VRERKKKEEDEEDEEEEKNKLQSNKKGLWSIRSYVFKLNF
jgi:hypothetical protein